MSTPGTIRAPFDPPPGPPAAAWVYLEFPKNAANLRPQPPYGSAGSLLIEAFQASFHKTTAGWMTRLTAEDGTQRSGLPLGIGRHEGDHVGLSQFDAHVDQLVAYRWLVDKPEVQESRAVQIQDLLRKGEPLSPGLLANRIGLPEGVPPIMGFLGLQFMYERALVHSPRFKGWKKCNSEWLKGLEFLLKRSPHLFVKEPETRLVRPLRDLVLEIYVDPPGLIARMRKGALDGVWGHPGQNFLVRRREPVE